jgi:hypothetical protein
MIDRISDALMAVIMLNGMRVLVGDVISRIVVGGGGSRSRARLCIGLIKRHDTGELSDHEQADQYRDDPPEASKPLHW